MAVPSQPRNVESLLWSFPIFKVSTNSKHIRAKVQFLRKRKITFWALFFVKSIFATNASTVWKSAINRDHDFVTKEVTRELISRKFFCVIAFYNRGVGLEIFVLLFDPEHTTPARVFRACLPWRAMVVCPETDRKVRRRFLARRLYKSHVYPTQREALVILLFRSLGYVYFHKDKEQVKTW